MVMTDGSHMIIIITAHFEERDEERDDGRTHGSEPGPLSSEQIAEDNANVRRSLDQHWLCSPQFPLSLS
jgi:hypothetical protein